MKTWIIIEEDTGLVIGETSNHLVVEQLNTDIYKAVEKSL